MEYCSSYQLSLLITERCNLSCSYCYCDKRRSRVMPIETALKAISDTLDSIGSRHLRILLMGGEPFLEFDVIKQITHYVRTRCTNNHIMIKTVTNGTLVHGEIQEWLTVNKDIFHTCLSLDGKRDVHNLNRCNSYDKIDIDFFLRTYGDDSEVSMVVCPENMDQLAINVLFLQKLGFRVKCVLADDCHWIRDRDIPKWAKQLEILSDFYLQHPDCMPFSQLCESLNIIGSGAISEKCMPGFNSHCINVDGNRYDCHRCTPYYNNGIWHFSNNDHSISKSEVLLKECYSCPARPICCSCPALVCSLKGDIELGITMCSLFKVTHMANAALFARMIISCPNHIRLQKMNDSTKRNFITGVQLIVNNLKQ